MKHLFLSYELALIAKEKGFNEPCLAFYKGKYTGDGLHAIGQHEGSGISGDNYDVGWNPNYPVVLAPLYDQTLDWFEKEKELLIMIDKSPYGSWTATIYKNFKTTHIGSGNFTFYTNRKSIDNEFAGFETKYLCLDKAIEEAFKLI